MKQKIFLVVGSLFPFDRLVKEVDIWSYNKTNFDIIAQVGNSKYNPVNIKSQCKFDAKVFNEILLESDFVISHAGMGIILKCLNYEKRLLVMPRRVLYKETTTDHQIATAKAFSLKGMINVAWDNEEIRNYLDNLDKIKLTHTIDKFAKGGLIDELERFINKS